MTIQEDLIAHQNPKKAQFLQRFFKTGNGQYAAGDKFLGITVPVQRVIAKKYRDLPLTDVQKLLASDIHEYRLCALFILCDQFKKSKTKGRKNIVDFYLKQTKHINNWDLVDSSAHIILGEYLCDNPSSTPVLQTLASSAGIWERRIAMIATYAFIQKNQFNEATDIAQMLVRDKHDLIQKAVGWMLREMGKRDMDAEEAFLQKHYKSMPRTMLRYAIERFTPEKRTYYMKK